MKNSLKYLFIDVFFGCLVFVLPTRIHGQVANPAPYSTTRLVNYVRGWESMVPQQVIDSVMRRPYTESKQTTQYVDGLGRLYQTVERQFTPAGKDLVTPAVYDAFDRAQYKYLPFAANVIQTGDIDNDGDFKFTPFRQDSVFNKGQFPGQTWFYGQAVYEASPIHRVQTGYAAGNSWVGSSKGVGHQFLTNGVSDSVRIWNIDTAVGSLPTSTATYSAGSLTRIITTDEQGNQSIEYTDKDGHVILKKIQTAASPGTGHVGWLCTYYIYDDLDNLRFVIQPKGVEWLSGNGWVLTGTYGGFVATELSFRYEYDQRKRVIIKKLPGAGEVWMVYDSRDRMVMTQDANLRAASPAKWQVIEYDSLNRPVRTGLLTDANTRVYHQNLASGSITYPSTAANYEVLTQSWYDDYSWVSGTGSGLGSTMATNHTSDANSFYTTYNASPAYAVAPTAVYAIRSMPTGTMAKVLNSSPAVYLYTVNFYDDHGRIIQTQRTNIKSGIDTTTTQYDFFGRALRVLYGHKKGGNNVQYHTSLSKYAYDASSRLKSVYQNIDGTGDQLIDSMQYNELGQLRAKYLGKQVDSLVYAYNIRGWMTHINKSFLTSSASTPPNYFGMELAYDNATDATGNSYVSPVYNGNIAGAMWKTGGDLVNRKYDYTYDKVNRLTGADFNQYDGSTFNKNAGVDFSVSGLSYDANGNILTMRQRGFQVNSSATLDSLAYTYINSGVSNQLQGVKDGANSTTTKLGDFHYPTDGKGDVDYSYDGNGNSLSDFNKSIDVITYNHLNLPQQVHMKGKGDIKYTYDALGDKLSKVTMDSISMHATTTLYMGPIVYQQGDTITSPTAGMDTLQFFNHEEGRARWAYHKYTNGTSGYKWEYDFYEKDHLGDVRMVLTQQRDTTLYKATMEAAYRATENALFYNIPSTSAWSYNVYGATKAYPSDPNATSPNDSVSLTNGNTPHEGPAIILKVMAGDVYNVSANAIYRAGQTSGGTTDALSDILTALANGIYSSVGSVKGSVSSLSNTTSSPLLPAVTSFRTANNPTPSSNPKAYLNYIALDDQFNYESSASGATPVGGPDTLFTLAKTQIRIKKNGYLYVYVTNETKNVTVFFDNLSVAHYTGPVLEETHYYPFGLVMQGISDKALKSQYAENKYKFHGKELQNKEFTDGSGLEWEDFGARDYDPQIARWTTIDPKADKYYSSSPYDFVDNDPLSRIDPTGKDWFNYQDKNDKEKTWHWQKGHKATYINSDGKTVTTKKGYQYLVTFDYDRGHTSEGAKRGTLTVYNQNKIAMQSSAFSGAGLLTGDFDPAAKGNYTMNLDLRKVMPKVNYNSDDNANPPPGVGMQKIEDGTVVKHPHASSDNVNSDYGNYRIRLTPTDGSRDRGLYLHGKDRWYNSRTHGCVCEKDQHVLEYIWTHPEIKGIVPFAIDEPHDTPKQ